MTEQGTRIEAILVAAISGFWLFAALLWIAFCVALCYAALTVPMW